MTKDEQIQQMQIMMDELANELEYFVHLDENGYPKSTPQVLCPVLDKYKLFKSKQSDQGSAE